jgi:putative acetyltransferase
VIRKATEDDFEFVYGLYMHPQVNPFLLYEMMSPEEFRPAFDALLHKDVKYIYENDESPVGMFKLVPNSYRSGHVVYLGGLAIHPDFAGKGYGLSMMEEIIQYAEQCGFLRIELSVYTDNHKAHRLYEKAGFEKEGILRKLSYLKSKNVFVDEVLMSWISEKIR